VTARFVAGRARRDARLDFEAMKGFLFRLVSRGLGLWAAETIVGRPDRRLGNLVLAALLLGIVKLRDPPIILILTYRLTVIHAGTLHPVS